ncbi:MAG: hypothetical protein M0Z95_17360 [Actinomycetota bacterium]|nr:hypothetical protein [Actinomycetota bacterium]
MGGFAGRSVAKIQANPLGNVAVKEENGSRVRGDRRPRIPDDGKELADAIDGFYRGG